MYSLNAQAVKQKNHSTHEGSKRTSPPLFCFLRFLCDSVSLWWSWLRFEFRFRRKICRMVPQDLLDILVCPVCKKPLVQKENGESLKCGECRRVYPVRDNIPILLVDEAATDPS